MHFDNKKKDILIFGLGPTQGLDDNKLTAEAQYSINFSRSNKICWSLHYNGSKVFYLLMLQVYINFLHEKYSLCLGNILGDFSANNLKKTGLNGCLYDISVDYRLFDTSNIDIHKYFIKKQ